MAAQNDDTAWMMEYIRHALPSGMGDWEHRLKDADDTFDIENKDEAPPWLGWSVSVERFASPDQNHDALASNNQELDLAKTSNDSVQNVPWQQVTPSLTQEAIDDLFPIKQKKVANSNQKTPSTLSHQLANLSPTHENAFGAYCHYDGRGITEPARSRRRRTCRFRVFMCVESKDPMKPIYYDVIVLATAEVHHVIGLACWLYTQDNREPLLKNSVEEYDIVIAEEDGTPEELPPLDRQSSITRYDFKFLAVVPRRRKIEHSSEEMPLKVILPDGSTEIRLKIEKQSITVAEIIEKAKQHVEKTIDFDFEYELVSNDVVLAKDEKIGEWKRRLFFLVRVNCKHVASNPTLTTKMNEEEDRFPSLVAFEAPIYREFSVFLLWRGHTPATLCISASKLDVLPTDNEKAESLFKTGLTSLGIVQVIKTEIKHLRDDWCIVKVKYERKEAKSKHSQSVSSKMKFECDPSTAEAIKSKLDALRQIIDVTQAHSSNDITQVQSSSYLVQ